MNIISKDFFSSIRAAWPHIKGLAYAKLEAMPKPDYRVQRDWGMPLIDAIDGGNEFMVYLGRLCILFPLKPMPVAHGG